MGTDQGCVVWKGPEDRPRIRWRRWEGVGWTEERKEQTKDKKSARWRGGNPGSKSSERRKNDQDGRVREVGESGALYRATQRPQDPKSGNGRERMDGKGEILPGGRRGRVAAVALSSSYQPTNPPPNRCCPLRPQAGLSKVTEPASWASVSATPPHLSLTGMWACPDIPLWAPS